MIRALEVVTRGSCEDLTQSELLAGVVRWLTVMTPTAGDEGLYRQVTHLRVEGEGAPGLERRYTVFFQQNAVLVKREALANWSPPDSWKEIMRALPPADAQDLNEHFRLARERLTIPVEADHVDRFEWKLGLAIAATFAEARDGLIVTDDGWFAVGDTGLVRIDLP